MQDKLLYWLFFSVFKVQLKKTTKILKSWKKVISNNEFLFEYTQEGDKCLVCHDSYSMESSRNYQNQQGDIISMVFFITIWIKILDKIKVQSGKIDQK